MDLIVIGIIALSVYLGYRKGFVELAVSLVATVIAIVLTFMLVTPVTNFVIENTTVDEYIEDVVIEKTYGLIKDGEEDSIKDQVIEQATSETMMEVAKNTSYNIIRVVVSILIYALIRIALIFVKILGRLVTKIPGIKQINNAGGIVYGLIRGLAIVYIALLVAREVATISDKMDIEDKIDKAIITKIMYQNNIFDSLVKQIEI